MLAWFRSRPRPHPHRMWLVTRNFAVQLKPNEVIQMAQTLHVDQIDTVTIVAVDAKGNVVPFTPDSPPIWTDSVPTAVGAAPSADGLSDVLTGLVVGQSSTIGVTVVVGGVSFTAQDSVSVVAGAIAGIQLVHTFSPKP